MGPTVQSPAATVSPSEVRACSSTTMPRGSHGEPELGGQLGARVDPDADDHDVGVQHGAVGELHPDGALVLTDEADSAGAQQDPRAAAFVRVADGVGQQRCDRPAEQAVARLDDGHRGAERAGARGDLEPDEATPDDDDLARLAEPGRQPVGVSQGAHRVDPVELGAVDGERPVDGARASGRGGRTRACGPRR